jgi:hypothetical protein
VSSLLTWFFRVAGFSGYHDAPGCWRLACRRLAQIPVPATGCPGACAWSRPNPGRRLREAGKGTGRGTEHRPDSHRPARRRPWCRLGHGPGDGWIVDGGQAGLLVAAAAGDGYPGHVLTADLLGPLAERGIKLSSSQVYWLVVDRPSLKILMALLDIPDCDMDDLIEPVTVAGPAKKTRAAGGGKGVGDLRPKRSRITPAGS